MESLMDRMAFLLRFFRSPRMIGSITPSSAHLVRAMLDPIPWEQVDTVVELGAGTGVITEALVQRTRPETHVIVFERDTHLRDLLFHRFPYLHHAEHAEKLGEELEQHGIGQVDCILSSLPFTNFPNAIRHAILDEVTERLAPDGMFVAYQYTLHMLPLFRERFHRVSSRLVFWNLPPAFVYVCSKPKTREKEKGNGWANLNP
ncbi:class I SAM-dependent methyltransferase [Polycladomyces subterraneus]|uniref:Methyltransferase n=1 Tax=Polycladomyces subterraneus TaxID=1016997 RepID=A0ABT8IRS6_9BACL|nr:methyltransferase [Polycladomyces subterraneus]MDN4595067.1 methyltransferase [Polycladomyces subterraneus]